QPPTPPTTHPSEPPPVGSPPGSGPHSVRVPASGGSRSFGSPLRVVPPFRVPAPGVPASRGPRPFGSPSLRAPALLGSLSRRSLSRTRPGLFGWSPSVVSLSGAENSRAFPVLCFGAVVTVVEPVAEPANPALPATVVLPDDPRYPSLLRGMNHRFTPRPDYVQVVTTSEQVVAAVTEAVRSGRRVTARSGGHCFEDFTASKDVQVLLDLSEMNAVAFDARRRAFMIEPGATLGHVYRTLFKGWGVTVPAGECTEVGFGGHMAGGGYGPL